MTFICEICGKKNSTEAGKTLHMKVYHKDELPSLTTKVKPEKAIKQSKSKQTATKKISKPNKEEATSLEAITEAKRARYDLVKKKFKQKPTNIENNEVVKKTKIQSIFPAEMETRLIGRSDSVNLHSVIEPSYKAMVIKNNKEWKRITLFGKTTKISWAEGPIGNKYKISYPTLWKQF